MATSQGNGAVPLSSAELASRLHVASNAIWEAGQLVLSYGQRPTALDVREKGPQDLVTAADHASDALLRHRLSSAFREDAFLTEESGGELGDRLWVIDPVDGTGNFARGLAHFCISIAFLDEGKPRLGLVYDPTRDELFVAQEGAGARCNGRPMSVSSTSEPGKALVDAGYSSRHPKAEYLTIVSRLVDQGYGYSQAGSAALGLAYVGDGRFDAFCELHLYAWDVLAGLLIVREAGGWTNDFLEGDGLARGNPVLACTPALAGGLRRLTGL